MQVWGDVACRERRRGLTQLAAELAARIRESARRAPEKVTEDPQ